MRSLLLGLSLVCAINLFAQDYSIKSVSLLRNDLRAAVNQRTDKEGNLCAMIRVNVVGVKDMYFPDSVGNVDYSLGEYSVYVPKNLKTFKIYSSEKGIQEEIVFEDYGIEEIESKRVYSIVLDSEDNTRAAIFSVHPVTASLKFNGKEVDLDETGMLVIEEKIGEYPYEVYEKGYLSSKGIAKLTEDEISSTINVVLQQIEYPLVINCNVNNATLYIDDVSYGSLAEVKDLKITEGKHAIRLTAYGYNDYEQQLHVEEEIMPLNVTLNEMKQEIIKYKKERTRTRVNIRNAHYISVGGALYNEEYSADYDYGLSVDYSYMFHFGGIFEFMPGISVGSMLMEGDEDMEDAAPYLEVPLMVGLGIPFGQYNKHLFSFLIGGYGQYRFLSDSSGTDFDYGVRVGIKLDISKFSIGVEYSKSLEEGYFPSIRLGMKLFKLEK